MRVNLLPIAVLAVAFGAAQFACSGPHSGKSEKLKKPREKERPEGEVAAEEAALEADTKCRTNFFADPIKKRQRKVGDARRIAKGAEPILVEAESAEGERRAGLVVEAIQKLSNALKKDPYSPEPTFKLAIAYALANKQGCSIALLERLATLQKHPNRPVASLAERTVQRALKDPAFDGFRKEADTALGE